MKVISSIVGNRIYYCDTGGLVNPEQIEKTPNPGQRVTLSAHGFKGVELMKKTGRWRAYIGSRRSGNLVRLGIFGSVEEAAQAYDEAAKERYGEAAYLNFPLNGEKKLVVREDRVCGNGHDLRDNVYQYNGRTNCRSCALKSQKRYFLRRKELLA